MQSMIVFRYSKLNGAEFFSHLDTLRHIQKTMIRAGIEVNRSLGFAKRMNIFMSSPIGVGQRSQAEYCLVDTEAVSAEEFMQKFNLYAPKYIRCLKAFTVSKKCNLAAIIDGATYHITGVNKFDVKTVMEAQTFFITAKDGKEKDVKEKIFNLKFEGDVLVATLASGNETLRADLFTEKLLSIYGGENADVLKVCSYIKGQPVDDVLERDYV